MFKWFWTIFSLGAPVYILTREKNEAMKMMWTAELHILSEDMIFAVVISYWKLLKTEDGDLKDALCYAVHGFSV